MNKRFSGYGLNNLAPIKDLNEEDASFDKNITIFQHNKNVDVAPKDDWDKKHPFKKNESHRRYSYFIPSFLVSEAKKFASPEDFIFALEQQGKIFYHGSPNDFKEFSYDYMGSSNGTGKGYGFYFTSEKDIALGYKSDKGKLFECYLNINKPLSLVNKKISKAQFSRLIQDIDSTGDGYLSNWGNAYIDGYNKVLKNAIDSIYNDVDNDVDLIGDLINGGLYPSDAYLMLEKLFGYDCIIANLGDEIQVVVFDNTDIISSEKLIEIWNNVNKNELMSSMSRRNATSAY